MPAPLEPYVRARDRGMSDEVRALSTRVIDPRAASKGFVVVALLGAVLLWWLAESLWRGADHEPNAVQTLQRLADPEPTAPGTGVRPVAILLLDGLRLDEAAQLPAMQAFSAGARAGSLLFPSPTFSTGAYHALVTGAPNQLTGVLTNRYPFREGGAVPRLDTLADRARAVGGRERYVAEHLDWLLQLLTPDPRARQVEGVREFDAAAGRAFAEFAESSAPGLLVVHFLSADESAHHEGLSSPDHHVALTRANTLIAGLLAAQEAQPALVAVVLADHGHVDVGGHGGDEPEVRRAPFALRGEGISPEQVVDLPPECVARVVSLASGLPTPRSSVCTTVDASVPGPVLQRVAFARDAARMQRLYHEARTSGFLAVAMLLTLMGLGATKRSFTGFDAASLVAPLVWIAGTLLAHRFLLDKRFTLSAMHLVKPHLATVGCLSALAAALGVLLGVGLATRRGRPPTPPRLALRRAAGALVWASIAAFGLCWARIGGSYCPWPLTASAAYTPVFLVAAGAGALLVAVLVLLGTIAKREDPSYERPTTAGDPPAGPGDIT